MKKTHLFSALALVFFVLGCTFPESEASKDHLTIVSWNVQNLFDGKDNGSEYDDFLNSSGWNGEKYQARLESIAAALKGESGVKADIIALVEVENEGVVSDLADKSFLDYGFTFFANVEGSSVGLGVLSALPVTSSSVHSFHSGDSSIPRPVAEVWVDTGTGPLVLLVCHWKSKLGGEGRTEALRRSGAALIARRLLEIETENPGTAVVIMGDLNENYDEFIRVGYSYPCALLPDTEEAAIALQAEAEQKQKPPPGIRPGFQDFLVISGEKPPIAEHIAVKGAALYSPWFEAGKEAGSYWYKDDWETIDHILINAALFGVSGLRYRQFRVLARPPFANAAGHPNAYNPRTGNGLSDHLPIVLVLDR